MYTKDFSREAALLFSETVVFADIETTGLSMNKGAVILEIGATKIHADREIEKFNKLIKVDRKIPKKITEITGITNDMLANKDPIEKVIPSFKEFINDAPIFFHNAQFDWNKFLHPTLVRYGLNPENEIGDTLTLARNIIPKELIGNHKLLTLAEYTKVPMETGHRAYNDALMTARVAYRFKKALKDFVNSKQQPLQLPKEAPKTDIFILDATIWQPKETKKGRSPQKRLYVSTNYGNAYYDYYTNAWINKDIEIPIDFFILELKTRDFLSKKESDPSLQHALAGISTYFSKK